MQKAKVICLILALVLSSVGTVMVAQNLNGDSPAVVLPTDAVNTYMDKPTEGDPSANDAITNLYIAAGELKRSGGFVGTTYGQTVSVGLAQEVSNKRTVVNGSVFKEMATVGVVKNAYQLYLYGDNYLYRKPDKINSSSDIKWANSAQKFTKDDFLGKFGHCSNELTGYILNDETVLEGTLEKQEDGLFTYRYVLDKVKAPAYMLYEMRANSNMKGFSTFIKAEIIVTMDANWQVKTLRTDCEYNVPMSVGVKCTEDITETFTEIGYQGDLPEKAFFEQFFDAQAITPVEPEDDALTVLMNIFEPYISGGKLNVELNAALKDTTVLTGLVSAKIDIEHLENIAVDVKLGEELYISYEQGKLFVTYQDFKGSTTVDGIMGLVDALMPSGIGGTSGSESDEEDDLLANAGYEVKDGVCAVNLPLSLGDTVLNVNFYANVDGDKYEFTSANATLGDITVNILPVTEVSVPERSGEYPEILGLTDLVKNGMVSAEVNAFGVSADVLFDLATNNLYAQAGDVELTMQQQTLFASLGELKLKLAFADINDLLTLVKNYINLDGAVQMPTVTLDGVLSALNAIKATSDGDGVVFSLGIDGLTANVKLVTGANGWNLQEIAVIFGENTVTLCPNDMARQIPAVNADEYVDVTDVAETFLTPVVNLIKAESYGAEFNANVVFGNKSYEINGSFVYDRFGNIAVNATASDAGKTLMNANVTVANGAVYLDVNGVKAAFKLSETNGGSGSTDISKVVGAIKGANETLDKLIESVLAIVDNVKNFDIADLDLKELVKSFNFENKTIDMTVNAQAFGLGEFGVKLSASKGNLTASVSGLTLSDIVMNVGATVKPNVKDVAIPNAEDYVTELELNVMDLTVNAKLDLYNMTAVAYTTLLNTELAVLYSDGTAYVNYGALKAKLNVQDIDRLVAVIKQFVPNNSDGILDGAFDGVDIAGIISGLGFAASDDGYALTLAFGGINAEVKFLTIGSDVTLDNVSVQIGDVKLNASLTNGNEYPQVDTNGCVDLVSVAETFAGEIKNLIDAQGYELNVNGTASFGGHAYGVNANVIYSGELYVKAGLSYNGAKMLDAEIWLVDNVLYLKSDKLTLAVQIGNDGSSNTGAKNLADTLNGLKGYNDYVDVLIDFVNQTVAKFSSGNVNYVNLVDSLEFDGSELTLAVNGEQLGLSDFVVKLNAFDGAGVTVSGLEYGDIALAIDNVNVKATDETVIRPDGDFTTNLTVKIDESNSVDVNLDLIQGVYKFKLKNLNACYADNKIRINYDDQILVQGDINRIMELVQRIDDLVHEFSGADKGAAGLDLTAMFGEINVKDIVKSLSIANDNGGVQIGLTFMGMNVTARFTDGKLDKIVVPVKAIKKDLEVRAADKANYYEFSDTDDYVAIEQILDEYMPAIEKLVATNCWKFTFTQDSFVTIDKTVYTLNAGSYFEFYYNETNKSNTQFRAKLSLSAPNGNGKNTIYSFDVALKQDENGVNRIYVSYNNKLRASVSLDAVMGCADEFTKLQTAIPQIGELVGKIFAAKEEVEGKEIDYSTILKDVSYVDQVFNMVINGNVLLNSLGDVTVNAGLYGNGLILNNFELKYDNIQVKLQGLTVEASATVNDKPYEDVDNAEDYTAVQDILAYDSATYHINLDSIKQLLSSVNFTATDGVKDEATGKMLRSFNIEGIVHLSVPLFGDVDIKIFAKVDINENEKTFFTIKLVRGNNGSVNTTESIVYDDNGGDSYLYFDGEQERITVIRNSWTKKEVVYWETEKYCTECGSKLNAFGTCFSKPVKHGSKYIGERQVQKSEKVFDYYAKDYAAENLTPAEFSADLMTHILEMVNLSDGIEKQITKQQDSNEILIENLIKDYKYSEINETMTLNDNSQVQLSGKFTVDLALSQISSALGDISLGIKHQDNGCLRNVSGSLKLVSLIDASLDLNLMSPNYGDATRIVENVGNSEIAYW